MNTIKKTTIAICLTVLMQSIAMEQTPPTSNRYSIMHLSTGQASTSLIERLAYVKDLMVKGGLLDIKNPIHLGYLNKEALNNLAIQGCSIRYNSLTNGIDTILIEKHLEDLPQDQQDSAIAHELAHIALRDKAAPLNPHNWLDNTLLGTAEIARWASVPLVLLGTISIKDNKPLSSWRKKCGYAGLSCMGLAVSNAVIIPLLLGASDTHIPNQPINYPIMQKPEEIMCDLIAATILPYGGCKGAKLYRTKLEYNGNKNGHHGDHPYTTTRIWYHDQLAQLQRSNKI